MFSSGAGTTPTTRVSRRAASRAAAATTTTRASSVAPSTTSTSAAPPPRAASVAAHSSSARTGATTVRAPGHEHDAASSYGMDIEVDQDLVQSSSRDNKKGRAAGAHVVERVLVKDDNYIVTERRSLPVEVQQAISLADPYTQPVQAVLDPVTGFGLLVTREYCFVWNWGQTSPSSTSYVFPLPSLANVPSSISALSPLSFACLVPARASSSSSTLEPGLVVVSPHGQVRLWETVSLSLSGVDRYRSATLAGFESSGGGLEVVRSLQALSPTCFLATTTSATRFYVITVNSVAGRTELGTRVVEKNVGWASSILSSVFGGSTTTSSAASSAFSRTGGGAGGILSLAVSHASRGGGGGAGEERVYAVLDKTAHAWNVSTNGAGERLVGSEIDVFAGVLEALEGRKVGNEQWAMNEGRVEIVDAGVTAKGELALLVSHASAQTTPGFQSWAIVLLNIVGTIVEVSGITRLSYQSRPDPRPLSTPKLSLSSGRVGDGVGKESSTAFVVFADAVVIVSLAQDLPFEENFPLRHNTNRFIGVSSIPPPSSSPSSSSSTTLSLLTSTCSLLDVTVTLPDSPLPLSITNTSETYKTRKLKSKVEHAIYFGIGSTSSGGGKQNARSLAPVRGEAAADRDLDRQDENLFKFDLQKDYEGDLAVAVEGVSQDLLASASPNMPVILDLRAQLSDRAHRARALIEYIQDNGLIGKLSQQTRRKLSWDAERIVAAAALWSHQNARLGEQSVLSESILTFMDEIGEGFGEDPLRLFFRSKIGSLGNVVEEVSKQARRVVSSTASSQVKSPVLDEANQVATLVFSAVARHRHETADLYALDRSTLALEAWSSRAALVEGLEWHFESTASLLAERVRDFGASSSSSREQQGRDPRREQEETQERFKAQMASLAEFEFSAIQERLLHLETLQGDGQSQPEARALNEKYLALRPRFIKTLVSIGQVPAAFELAERHQDFRSLVELATDPRHGSIANVRAYLDEYGQSFAFPLYEYYLEKGQVRSLLEPNEAHRPLVTAFLDATSNSRLSWINDVAVGRYGHANEALVQEATNEQSLSQKKVLFSLGKLAQIAQVSKETIESEPVQRAIEGIDDHLDLVNSQQGLGVLFESLLSQAEGALSREERGQLVASRSSPHLSDRPTFAKMYAALCARILSGHAVSVEELVDLETLKLNVNDRAGDFAAALDVLVRAKELPQARRRVALESVWRRVYLQDDWSALRSATGLKDEEMANALRNTALYATLSHAAPSNHDESMYLEPLESLPSVTLPLLGAIHGSSPRRSDRGDDSSYLAAVLCDYDVEKARLERSVAEDGLDRFAKEVVRLWKVDQAESHGRDGDGDDDDDDEIVMVE